MNSYRKIFIYFILLLLSGPIFSFEKLSKKEFFDSFNNKTIFFKDYKDGEKGRLNQYVCLKILNNSILVIPSGKYKSSKNSIIECNFMQIQEVWSEYSGGKLCLSKYLPEPREICRKIRKFSEKDYRFGIKAKIKIQDNLEMGGEEMILYNAPNKNAELDVFGSNFGQYLDKLAVKKIEDDKKREKIFAAQMKQEERVMKQFNQKLLNVRLAGLPVIPKYKKHWALLKLNKEALTLAEIYLEIGKGLLLRDYKIAIEYIERSAYIGNTNAYDALIEEAEILNKIDRVKELKREFAILRQKDFAVFNVLESTGFNSELTQEILSKDTEYTDEVAAVQLAVREGEGFEYLESNEVLIRNVETLARNKKDLMAIKFLMSMYTDPNFILVKNPGSKENRDKGEYWARFALKHHSDTLGEMALSVLDYLGVN